MSISPQLWSKFKSIHRTFFEGIAARPITWFRLKSNHDRWGEGESPQYEEIELKAVLGYNYFRTWPTNQFTETGALDKESMYVYINRQYLKELGYINKNGNFDMDPVHDKFLIDGIMYYPDGDSNIALAYDDPMYYMIILSREVVKTGKKAR